MKALILVLMLGALTVAMAGPQSKTPDPNLHYAYRHEAKGESEHLSVNWTGSISWTHGTADVVWVQDKGKVYQIIDKAVLEAMHAATVPLRKSSVTAQPGTKQYQDDREKERNAVYAKTDKIVRDAMAKGLGTVITP